MLKKLGLWALALLTLAGTARAASVYCVNAPGVAALVDAGGAELLSGEGIEAVFAVREGALYAAGRRGAYRLYGADGSPLGQTEFSMIDDAGDALVFASGGLYGAMDASGEVLLPPIYTQLTGDGAGGWLALEGDPLDERPDELIHIDASGARSASGVAVAAGLGRVSCGRLVYMSGDGLYGATDAAGRPVIYAVWRYLGTFEGGFAKVVGPEGAGLVDVDGRMVIAPMYAYLERGNTMVAAWDGEGVDVYPPGGGARRFRVPGPIREVAIVGGCLSVAREDGVALYDAQGRRLAEAAPGTTYAPGLRGQLIASDGAWGERCQWLVNPNGSVGSGRFQQLLPLCPGRYAWLALEGRDYYSAELGGLQTSWNYAEARYGLANDRGGVLLPAQYREIRALDADRLLLVGDGEVRLANRDGATIKTWVTSESEAPSGEAGE